MNLTKVKAWINFQENVKQCRSLLDEAALSAKQTKQHRKRSIEIEVKGLEMEKNQKQLELELAKLEDVAQAKEKTEIAKLEVKLAKAEYSELVLLNAQSSSHSGHVSGLAFGITSNTSSLTPPRASTQSTRLLSCPRKL